MVVIEFLLLTIQRGIQLLWIGAAFYLLGNHNAPLFMKALAAAALFIEVGEWIKEKGIIRGFRHD